MDDSHKAADAWRDIRSDIDSELYHVAMQVRRLALILSEEIEPRWVVGIRRSTSR